MGSAVLSTFDGQFTQVPRESLKVLDLRSCKRFMPRTRILDHVQTALDAQHHLIVAHDVTNVGHDRDQLNSPRVK